MTVRQGGGVGAFGWTLLGFLAGVAATLAVQLFLVGGEHGDDSEDEPSSSASAVVVAPKLPPPTTIRHHLRSSEAEADMASQAATAAGDAAPNAPAEIASAAAKPKPKSKPPTPDAQVEDDAAAAGMTSRANPDKAPPR